MENNNTNLDESIPPVETPEQKMAYLEEENRVLKEEKIRNEEDKKKSDELIRVLREDLAKLGEKFFSDSLTELRSREFFIQYIGELLQNIKEPSDLEKRENKIEVSPISVVFFDIDNFKSVNDIYGHEVGNIVLKRVAKTIKECVRDTDMAARWGGDEMLVAMTGANEGAAVTKANFIREKISKINFSDVPNLPKDFKVTISGGVASSDDFKEFGKLVEAADKAMYESKHTDRNKVTAYSEV